MIRASVLGLALALGAPGLAHAQAGYGPSNAQTATPAHSIEALQRALRQAGYDPGPIDGAMGPKTREAIRQFQRDAGLPPTGEPGAQLYAQLLGRTGTSAGSAYPVPPSEPPYDRAAAQRRSDRIADVQLALRSQGYDIRSISGDLDMETRAAIRAFEREQGLPVTGQLNPPLLAALGVARDGWGAADRQGREAFEETRTRQSYGMRQPGPNDLGTLTAEQRRLVSDVQRELAERGYDVGPIDGVYGPKVRQAIAAFEEQAGIPVTGQPSPELLARLTSAPPDGFAARRDIEEMDRDELIRTVEILLRDRGYDTGPVDARLDPQTEESIRRFQRERGYAVTGLPTMQLLSELQAPPADAERAGPPTPEDLAGEILRGFGARAIQQLQNSGQ